MAARLDFAGSGSQEEQARDFKPEVPSRFLTDHEGGTDDSDHRDRPHKASDTTVAIGRDEQQLGEIKVRATCQQTEPLLAWAEPLGEHTWAVESAGGLGYLLSQQLVRSGEQVLDVPAIPASRVRVLGTGRSDKNDPNDALSVATAALRSPGLRSVKPANHQEVLRLLATRDREAAQHGRLSPPCRIGQPLTRWKFPIGSAWVGRSCEAG